MKCQKKKKVYQKEDGRNKKEVIINTGIEHYRQGKQRIFSAFKNFIRAVKQKRKHSYDVNEMIEKG